MSNFIDTCPIWGTQANMRQDGPLVYINSYRAGGDYSIDWATMNYFGWASKGGEDLKVRITDWIIRNQHRGRDMPAINDHLILNEIKDRSLPSPIEQCNFLMKALIDEFPRFGELIRIQFNSSTTNIEGDPDSRNTYSLMAHARVSNEDEFYNILRELTAKDWIRPDGSYADWNVNSPFQFSITIEGREYVAGLSKNVESNQGFVAMWFDDSMKEAYEDGIKPAIEEAGYEACRIDELVHNDKICDQIIAEIRKSRFVVADFSCAKIDGTDKYDIRGGVYFEAGFAMGLGIPVIWTCKKDVIDSLHFDTRQYNHIAWETPEDLEKQLTERINATII